MWMSKHNFGQSTKCGDNSSYNKTLITGNLAWDAIARRYDFQFYRKFLTKHWFLNHLESCSILSIGTTKGFFPFTLYAKKSESHVLHELPLEQLYYITENRRKSTHVKSYIRADWILCHLPNVIIYEWYSACMLRIAFAKRWRNKEGNWISNLSIYSNSVVCSISDTKSDTVGIDPFIFYKDRKI